MGAKDTATKALLRNPENFADLINILIYDGKPVVRPESLREIDTAYARHISAEGKVPYPIDKYRDVVKQAEVVMEGEGARYVTIGCENQSKQDFSMAIRCALYDALEYQSQYQDTGKKIMPVITIVLYWGDGDWNAPLSLHEILDLDGSSLARFVPDYRMNVISMAKLKNMDLTALRSELATVLRFLCRKNDSAAVSAMLAENPKLRKMSVPGAATIKEFANISITIPEEEGAEVDMCKAIEDMLANSRDEGITKGRAEGVAEFMLKKAFPIEDIEAETGLNRDAILALRAKMA